MPWIYDSIQNDHLLLAIKLFFRSNITLKICSNPYD